MSQLNFFGEEPSSSDVKICNKCEETKPLSHFGNASGGKYLRSECKSCANELRKVRESLKLSNPPPKEGYTCPICNRDEHQAAGLGNKTNGPWVLDHCHDTHEFRGYLCHDCNRKLGGSDKDPEWFNRARDYILNRKV